MMPYAAILPCYYAADSCRLILPAIADMIFITQRVIIFILIIRYAAEFMS